VKWLRFFGVIAYVAGFLFAWRCWATAAEPAYAIGWLSAASAAFVVGRLVSRDGARSR
jgi:hypothetical protein